MGYYIEVPERFNKAEQLVDIYDGEIVARPATFKDIPEGKALICVVSNPAFDAAGFCYSAQEFDAFSEDFKKPDRPRKWVLIDYELAKKLTFIPLRLLGKIERS